MNIEIKSKRIGNIEIFYHDKFDGGGHGLIGQDFVKFLREHLSYKNVNKLLEVCCGDGFIGFSLLSMRICKELTLIDINKEAIEICDLTISKNPYIKNKVKTYVSNGFKSIPNTEKFDVIIGNPPHFYTNDKKEYMENIKKYDYQWEWHKNFYLNAKYHLKPNGIIILLENEEASYPTIFKDMIENGGLTYINKYKASWKVRGIIRTLFGHNPYYYLKSVKI